MGSLNAAAMAEAVETGDIDLAPAIRWHLGSNHFPPISADFDAIAIAAIELAASDVWDEGILLPNGRTLTVADIIEGLRLEYFVECAVDPGPDMDDVFPGEEG